MLFSSPTDRSVSYGYTWSQCCFKTSCKISTISCQWGASLNSNSIRDNKTEVKTTSIAVMVTSLCLLLEAGSWDAFKFKNTVFCRLCILVKFWTRIDVWWLVYSLHIFTGAIGSMGWCLCCMGIILITGFGILTVFFSVLQYKGAHVKPGFAEHFYSNPGRYKGRENMLVSRNLMSK